MDFDRLAFIVRYLTIYALYNFQRSIGPAVLLQYNYCIAYPNKPGSQLIYPRIRQ